MDDVRAKAEAFFLAIQEKLDGVMKPGDPFGLHFNFKFSTDLVDTDKDKKLKAIAEDIDKMMRSAMSAAFEKVVAERPVVLIKSGNYIRAEVCVNL